MRWLFIAMPIILLLIICLSNEMSSNYNLIEERKESYEACIKLKIKAPYFNLNCEHLLNRHPILEAQIRNEEMKKYGIKTLSIYESNTRKVSKIEEIKLRKLIDRIANKNKL